MKKVVQFVFLIVFVFLISGEVTKAQVHWVVGGKMGLSIADGNAGFQIGPMGEVLFNKNMAVGTELNINSQAGTPIEWEDYFKYYFDIPNSNIKPYANGGIGLYFFTGGPYFGIRFGGGANFEVAPNLYIPADIQLGPIFGYGPSTPAINIFGQEIGGSSSTIFAFAITTGIRYYIP